MERILVEDDEQSKVLVIGLSLLQIRKEIIVLKIGRGKIVNMHI